ncbi:nucleoside hydrolase [Cohnella caldifontis]|uniref:nucleoside hydrolase n=1 Tax=Cohnella caldifontis TaxID=3027471 RepID=UPI0023EC10EE|nr:nucleoside hydrolase [Cohnella sp. YIM B05605]
MDDTTRIMLDLNAGPENALAVLLAARSPRFTLEGITSVFGTSGAEEGARNALLLAELAAPDRDIPVAIGAAAPLLRECKPAGAGGWALPEPKRKPVPASAAELIVERLNRHRGRITLICCGPLTNVALALVQDPGIADKAKRLVIAGGALKAPGDVTPVSERNLWSDPEAAFRVFRSGIPITLLGLDVTREAALPPELLRSLVKESDAVADFLEQIIRTRTSIRGTGTSSGIPAGDALAVAVAADPGLVETEGFSVMIEIKGTVSRGATLVDLRKGLRPTVHNCDSALKVNNGRLAAGWTELMSRAAKGGAR